VKYLILIASLLTGCAWYQAQWNKKDTCYTTTCPRYADANMLTFVGGEYDPQAEACACAMAEGKDVVLFLIPFAP
jgi:hypothetical protein